MSDPHCEPACPKCRKDQHEMHGELARLRDQLAKRERGCTCEPEATDPGCEVHGKVYRLECQVIELKGQLAEMEREIIDTASWFTFGNWRHAIKSIRAKLSGQSQEIRRREAAEQELVEVRRINQRLVQEEVRLRQRIDRAEEGLMNIQRHRDAWRGFAYQKRPRPDDFLDGNMCWEDRGPTLLDRAEAAERRAAKLREAVRWARGLIVQLPHDHDGRNSWLLNDPLAADADAPEPVAMSYCHKCGRNRPSDHDEHDAPETSGAGRDAEGERCDLCDGTGSIQLTTADPDDEIECGACDGTGVITDADATESGAGRGMDRYGYASNADDPTPDPAGEREGDGRCASRFSGLRCERLTGHYGPHRHYLSAQDNKIIWADGDEDIEVPKPDTVAVPRERLERLRTLLTLGSSSYEGTCKEAARKIDAILGRGR